MDRRAKIAKALEIVRERMTDYVIITSEVLYEFFTTQPCGLVLEVSSTLIGMFGSEEKTTQVMNKFYSLLITSCLNLLDQKKLKQKNVFFFFIYNIDSVLFKAYL